MSYSTHSARVISPIPYTSALGRAATIPPGPCLVEERDDAFVDVVWGRQGERSAQLPRPALEAAEQTGQLVLLD